MTRKERQDLIEKYQKNQLEGISLKRFERLLETDKQLKRELNLEVELSDSLGDYSDYNLFKRLLEDAEADYHTPEVKGFPIWKMAAAIAFIMCASIVLFFLQSPTPEEYFAANFEPYRAPTNLRGVDISAMDDDFMLGLLKYEDQKYSEAIRLFEAAIDRDSLNYTARFLTGVSYLALKDFERAEPILLALSKNPNHLFQEEAGKYLRILYLSDDDKSNDEQEVEG